jgi:hypothetical protein
MCSILDAEATTSEMVWCMVSYDWTLTVWGPTTGYSYGTDFTICVAGVIA